MVIDEHKFNPRFGCTQIWQWRKMLIVICKTVAALHSVVTCHCEAYAKTHYPVDTLMVTLLWVVVICHTIFQTGPVYFWCFANEVKYWWFDICTCSYTKLIFWMNVSFAHHICCCFIVCKCLNCFIDQNSQLDRLLTWHILIVDYCVK